MWSIPMWTNMRTILGVIFLGLCCVWQIGVCGGQTAGTANSGSQSAEEARKASIAQDAKDSATGPQATLGALPSPSTNSQTPVSHRVTLTWKASVSANKPSPDPVNGYNVYRGTNSPPDYTKPINSSPVKDTKYVDLSVEPGKKYFYAVKTVTVKGVESNPSNKAKAVIPSR
jgi:fibronectin type 3 domain-containing protein